MKRYVAPLFLAVSESLIVWLVVEARCVCTDAVSKSANPAEDIFSANTVDGRRIAAQVAVPRCGLVSMDILSAIANSVVHAMP
jgi:hypothetical protein